MKKLEVFYIANKSENIYFTLLGDCTSSKNEKEDFDNEVIQSGLQECERLNQKYPDKEFPKFNFVYRKRTWNNSESCYLGWERKRGLLNQFNEYILGNEDNCFLTNTFESVDGRKVPLIKYIITLDSDTNLVLNTAFELVGAMAHILNRPVLNKEKNIVIDGYGIMQPRVGIGLLETRKSIFTKIFSGLGGTDSYTNAISDFYHDNFGEGIFTGKGIYDLRVFSEVLKGEIPENTVLSHDLLEGCYIRCGLASDIVLMDGYPSSYNSYKTRLHRWIRGDYQILAWILKDRLNILSKYKILENTKIAKDVFKMILEGDTTYITRPGQFINIEIDGFYLRRPISVCDYDENTVTIIYKIMGNGTEKMSTLPVGSVLDILTGLGNGFNVNCKGDVPLLIGGGVGTPPMYRLCKVLQEKGKNPIVVLGFNSKEDVFYEEEFKKLGVPVYISTVDGSYGTKGFVTDVMKNLNNYSYFYACGPLNMLKAVADATGCEGQLSFEERMGCGFGACMGCTCKTKYGNKRICKDGPVLKKEEVIW